MVADLAGWKRANPGEDLFTALITAENDQSWPAAWQLHNLSLSELPPVDAQDR